MGPELKGYRRVYFFEEAEVVRAQIAEDARKRRRFVKVLICLAGGALLLMLLMR